VIQLGDGRAFGWSEYGSRAGFPVVSCHGGLSCRLDVATSHAAAVELGVRVISPDRPGVGLSDCSSAATLLGFAADVAELLDRLEIDRCAVMGWSLGGAYAAACGAALAERISAVTLIASVVPFGGPVTAADLHLLDRACLIASRSVPGLLSAVLRLNSMAATRAPRLFTRLSFLTLDRDARSVLRRRPEIGLAAFAAEGLRNPAGAVDDYRILDRPWGFELSAISAPVSIWQGDADGFVPLSWAQQLAARIPHAQLHICAGAGHLLAYERYPQIFADLLAQAGAG
jgi:pimeloyl-ACP methyl ester carboxylesterase